MTRMLRTAFIASLILVAACETAPEGVESDGQAEGSDLSGIVMEKDGLADDLGKAQGIAGKEGANKQQQAEVLELSQAFEERYGKKLDGIELTEGRPACCAPCSPTSRAGLKGPFVAARHPGVHQGPENEIDELKAQLPTPEVSDSHPRGRVPDEEPRPGPERG